MAWDSSSRVAVGGRVEWGSSLVGIGGEGAYECGGYCDGGGSGSGVWFVLLCVELLVILQREKELHQ